MGKEATAISPSCCPTFVTLLQEESIVSAEDKSSSTHKALLPGACLTKTSFMALVESCNGDRGPWVQRELFTKRVLTCFLYVSSWVSFKTS